MTRVWGPDVAAPVAPPREAPRAPWIVWAGLAVVLAAAAVLSFDALRGLALAVSIPEQFAWLLPIAVDAGAAVSCATWLGNRTPPHAARFAGRMTWSLLAVTVVGNAGQLGMHAHHIAPPWWVAVLVGTIPPAVVGSVVHLVVLLVRVVPDRAGTVGPLERPVGPGASTESPELPETPELPERPETPDASDQEQTTPDPLVPAVREWLDRQTGTVSQRQLRAEFSVGAERARALLEAAA